MSDASSEMSPEMKAELSKPAESKPSSAPSPKSNPEKKIEITLDFTPAKVLSYDKDGYILLFNDSPEKFLELPLAVIRELSLRNRESYSVSYTFYKKLLEERDNPPSGITVEGRAGTATQRLKVVDERQGLHKVWIRPDQISEFQAKGYKVTSDPRVKTFGSSPSSTHTVGVSGSPELVLVEIPQSTFQKDQEAIGEKSARKSRAVDESTAEDIARAGGKPPDRFGAKAYTPRKKEVVRQRVR